MQNFNPTPENALLAHQSNSLLDWVQQLLISEGNSSLAESLSKEDPILVDIINVPLSLLKKIEGPEEDVESRLSPGVWEGNVSKLTELIKNGYKPSPLIVTDYWNYFEIADGNHRHEALLRNGIKSYWTIFLIKHPEGKKYFLKKFKKLPKFDIV